MDLVSDESVLSFCAILWDDTGHRQGASVDLQPDKVRSDTFFQPRLNATMNGR